MPTINDLKLNKPTKKTQLNKLSMLKFIKENGSAEDKKWFYDLMQKNKKKVKNNLTGEVVDGYDLPAIREAFAQKFFPEISSKAKREKKVVKKTLSFDDELEALLK